METPNKTNLLGVGITNATESEILEFIYTGLQKNRKKYYIVTPNPELLMIAHDNPEYKTVLNGAQLALPDGIGVVYASKFMAKPIRARITGVDFTKTLCKYISDKPVTAGFLGGGPGVAEETAHCLQKMYPGLKISWFSQEYKKEYKAIKTDILFVAFGSPKQEIWISKNINNLNVKVVMGVGGAFDLISGKVPRAPKVLQKIGLEWLFRLIIQPWRIRRQLKLLKFILTVLSEKLKNN